MEPSRPGSLRVEHRRIRADYLLRPGRWKLEHHASEEEPSSDGVPEGNGCRKYRLARVYVERDARVTLHQQHRWRPVLDSRSLADSRHDQEEPRDRPFNG